MRDAARQPEASSRVVACVLLHADEIAVLRRSSEVRSDRGKWHCVTGFMPPETSPLKQAVTEVVEETGVASTELDLVYCAPALTLDAGERTWTVFPFLFQLARTDLELNWENSEYRWVPPTSLKAMDCVPWLYSVLQSLPTPSLPSAGQVALSA